MDEKKGLAASAKAVSRRTMERLGRPVGRSLHLTGAACAGNALVGLGKLIVGIVSLSPFACASALYTFGMVTAKSYVLAGVVREEGAGDQRGRYRRAGLILIGVSLLYMLYSARLFFYPANSAYPMSVALAIAAFTFTELTLNLRGVIIERKNHTLLVHAVKMLNLASSLICLVLTQTAILSISSDRMESHSAANGLIGVIMGGAAALLGAAMVLRVGRIQKREAEV